MRIHFLKTHSTYFKPVVLFKKNFEIRLNDRDFNKGDILVLIATDDKGKFIHPFTTTSRVVDYVLQNTTYLQPGYVAMSISIFSVFAYLNNENFEIFRGHYDRISLGGETLSYEAV